MMIPEEVQKNLFLLKSCACDIAREAFESDPDFDPTDPDENSEAFERFEVAKELGQEWGCPNWRKDPIDYSGTTLPEHKLEKLHSVIEKPKDKKHLAIIAGYEKFIGYKGKESCYKTCPKFYLTNNSPISEEITKISKDYRWFVKNQYTVVNPNPSQFDIDAIDALQDGNYLADKYQTDKMKKENDEIKKRIEKNSVKEKTIK